MRPLPCRIAFKVPGGEAPIGDSQHLPLLVSGQRRGQTYLSAAERCMRGWHMRDRHLPQGGNLNRKTADKDNLIEAVAM